MTCLLVYQTGHVNDLSHNSNPTPSSPYTLLTLHVVHPTSDTLTLTPMMDSALIVNTDPNDGFCSHPRRGFLSSISNPNPNPKNPSPALGSRFSKTRKKKKKLTLTLTLTLTLIEGCAALAGVQPRPGCVSDNPNPSPSLSPNPSPSCSSTAPRHAHQLPLVMPTSHSS